MNVPKSVELPEIPFTETVDLKARETALIVVDMQRDFVDPAGKLPVPTAPQTVPVIRTLLDRAREAGVRIFYTMDTHLPTGDPEFEIWGEHVVEGTPGWEIVDDLKPRAGDVIIRKTRYDGFYGTPLDEYLRLFGIRQVVVTGTVANICVLHTAGSAALRFYRVVVPVDAISALHPFDLWATLRQITFLYRGVFTRSEGIRFHP